MSNKLKEKRLFLVRYADNYADEFDIEGHVILDERQLAFLYIAIEKVEYFEFYFGTNEGIEYEDSEQILSTIEYDEISEDDLKTLQKLNLTNSGEAMSFIERIVENYADQEDEKNENGFATTLSDELGYFFKNLRKLNK